MNKIATLVILSLLTACAGFKPALDQAVETGDNAIVSQQATQADGSNKVDAENVESVTTVNEASIGIFELAVIMLIILAFGLLMGIIIPQPAIVKRVW
jgi:uncharacterized membrane protein YgcG